MDVHKDTVRSRKDAAILKLTHEGCTTCGGLGMIATRKKDGTLTGSKSCTAAPTRMKVSRWEINKAARLGADKSSGLTGWSCPCGKKEKARYRDAKTATAALRAHEKQKHGGKGVGGTWYAQVPAGAAPATPAKQPAAPVTKTNIGKTMTDQAWEKQNKPPSAAKAARDGLCRSCTNGALYSAFGGQQITAVCPFCKGTGKAPVKTTV